MQFHTFKYHNDKFTWKPDFAIRDERVKGRTRRLYWLILGRRHFVFSREVA